jgi:hypothetical protein
VVADEPEERHDRAVSAGACASARLESRRDLFDRERLGSDIEERNIHDLSITALESLIPNP